MSKSKKILIAVAVVVSMSAIAYSCYSLFAKSRDKYRRQGYNTALQQIMDTVKHEGGVNLQVGDQQVKLKPAQ